MTSINSAKVIKVIETHTKEGKGIEDDPVRIVRTYWDLKGNILAFSDPFKNSNWWIKEIEKRVNECLNIILDKVKKKKYYKELKKDMEW